MEHPAANFYRTWHGEATFVVQEVVVILMISGTRHVGKKTGYRLHLPHEGVTKSEGGETIIP